MRRTIREKEPLRPSTRLSTMLENELTTTAKHRHIDAPKLVHLLRGDLDWIVMKCLEKDRGRRYETANGLARDIQRFLANEPVVARPPSRLYRFQKLARRNTLAFAAAGAVAVALITGLAVSAWEYLKERQARQRAVAAEQQAEAFNKFLTEDLLFQATPERNSREKQVTMEEVLNVATSNLDHNAEIARQPELEATLRLAIGRTYHKLGNSAEANRNLRRAFELRRREFGPTNPDTLEAEFWLADYLQDLAHDYVEAGMLLLHTWQVWQKTLGQEDWNTLGALEAYGITLYQTAHFTEAERIARYILSIRERTKGLDHPATITALQNLAAAVGLRGDHAQAESLSREIIRRCDRSGANGKVRFIQLKELASYRTMQGDPAEAATLMTREIPSAAHELGLTHPYTLHMQRTLARALAEEECFVEAEALARSTLEERLRQTIDQEGNGRTMLILGRALMQQGKLDEAEHLLQAALPLLRQYIGTRDAGAALAANWLGVIQVARGAYPEAEKLLLPDSDRFFDPANQLSPTEVRLAVSHIVQLYQAWGKPEQAAIWQRKLNGLMPIASTQMSFEAFP
jgi:tetratricopeptide (TPR) repeat protein